MKRTPIVILSVIMSSSLLADAELQAKDTTSNNKLNLSIGLKNWQHSWQSSVGIIGSDIDKPGFVTSNNSDPEVAIIPVANLSYDKFFASISYYTPTKFNFPRFSFLTSDNKTKIVDMNADRSEWDLSAGYGINKNASAFLGYKDIKQTFNRRIDTDGTVANSTVSSNTSGPVIGISGHSTENGLGIYGTVAHGFLKSKVTKASEEYDVSYNLAETGVTYSIISNGSISHSNSMTAYAGYRFQTYLTEDVSPSGEDGSDTTDGFVAGINLNF